MVKRQKKATKLIKGIRSSPRPKEFQKLEKTFEKKTFTKNAATSTKFRVVESQSEKRQKNLLNASNPAPAKEL